MITMATTGRISNDFELQTKDGCTFVRFGLAVNEYYKGENIVTFFSCIAYDTLAIRLQKAKAKKASVIAVTGKFKEHKYTKEGVERTSLQLTILDWTYPPSSSSKKEDGSNDSDAQAAGVPAGGGSESAYEPPYEMLNLDDDDLPF